MGMGAEGENIEAWERRHISLELSFEEGVPAGAGVSERV